jgi:hypothetical protein
MIKKDGMLRTSALTSAFVLVLAAAPASGQAFSNAIELRLSTGSGDLSERGLLAKVKQGGAGSSYTHYFTDMSTGNEPYGELVFLQHPSELSLELTGTNAEATVLSKRKNLDEGTFEISGTFFFPNKRTGLGLAIVGIGRESAVTSNGSITNTEKESVGASRLFVQQYVVDAVRVGLSLNSEDAETRNTFPWDVVKAPG